MDFGLQDLPNNKLLTKYAEQFPEVDVLSVEICLKFLSTARKVSDAYQFYFSQYGLSEGKFTLLMLLFREPNHTLIPSELAEKAGVTRGTVTGLLDGLEKTHWIKRQHNQDDRRKLTIILSEEGKERLIQMLPDHFLKTSNLLKSLSDDEKRELNKLIEKIYLGTFVLYEKKEEERK